MDSIRQMWSEVRGIRVGLFGKSLVVLASLVLGGLASFLISIFAARSLSVEHFGIYTMVLVTQNVVIMFGQFGIPRALARFISEYRVRDSEQANGIALNGFFILTMISLASVAVYSSLASAIGLSLFKESVMVDVIPYSALAALSSTTLAAISGIAQGCQKMGLYAKIQSLSPALSLIAIIVLTPILGVRGVFLGFFLGQILVVVFTLRWFRSSDFNFLGGALAIRKSGTMKSFLQFSSLSFLSSLVVIPVLWIGNTELTVIAGFQFTAYFGAASIFFSALILIPTSVTVPLLPRVSELSVVDPSAIGKIMIQYVRVVGTIFFPIVLIAGLFSEYMLGFLFGASYLPAADTVFLLAIAGYFYALGSMVSTMMFGVGRIRVYLVAELIWAISFLLSVFIAIPLWGLPGLGLAYAVSYAVLLSYSVFASTTILDIDLSPTYLVIALSSSMLTAVFVLTLLFDLDLILRIALIIGGCFAALILLRETKRLQ